MELSQVLPVQPKQIETIKRRLPSPVQKFIELATALRIQAANLTVQNRIRSFQFCQRSLEGFEAFIGVFSAGNQIATAPRNVREGAETIGLPASRALRSAERCAAYYPMISSNNLPQQFHRQSIERIFHFKPLCDVCPFVVFRLRRVVFEHRLNLEPHFEIDIVFVHDRLRVRTYQSPTQGGRFFGGCPEFRPAGQASHALDVHTPRFDPCAASLFTRTKGVFELIHLLGGEQLIW